MSIPSSRNGAGKGSVGFYVVGVICAAVGIYLATMTRINLVTGQSSSPYLDVGIVLAAIGIVVVVVAQRTAKQNLRR